MKKILLLLMLTCSLFAFEQYQIDNIKKCYKAGIKYNLQNTMAATCSKESSGGKYKINADSKDFGIAQNNIKTALKRLKLKNNWSNRNLVMTKLVLDDNLSIELALEEYNYWISVHGNNWNNVWGSYNAGWKYKSLDARNYSASIAKEIQLLKKLKIIP